MDRAEPLVQENELLTIFIPATQMAFVFRVRARVNMGFERFHYGPLPIPAGTPLASYLGGLVTAPADGVMPAMSFTPIGLSFPMRGVYDETDMWYVPEDYRDRLFHVILEVTPAWLRCDLQIPKGVPQNRFQRDKIITGLEMNMGFARGRMETVHIPKIHYGYRFGNDTNVAVRTAATFTYAEYIVEIPKDEELVFNVLTRRAPSRWITLPVNNYDTAIRSALLEVYGFEGFPLYPATGRERALREYRSLLAQARV